ncbi:type V toxin-antitoxin system endoribonuclease antitoxin GhoS [Pseudomonas qingdaonensis]|uniref:type V toxin-antitoxin system endoribonuclease antitoxin GhoS n=1 Tax=Pseudomonas qingdaonensis TaxID=2056231 RepID=UPI0018CAFD5A|nr:type V toxin-antitoxin system endoribonuclease antitoxin GhoS [Pseudomonas qingdaonensis]MBG8560197.1 type V toxin-antitoxin system endoribonuclease antitoxin GhoS [Pseudomonas qingdaonensis]
MSVDNVVRNYQQNQAKRLLARLEEVQSGPHTLAPQAEMREFIVRVQLSHEHHYDEIHELLAEAGFARTITTQDGIRRDLPHAMFYLRTHQENTSKIVFAAVVETLEKHAKQHPLRDLNPQIMVMDAKAVYLNLDPSKHP